MAVLIALAGVAIVIGGAISEAMTDVWWARAIWWVVIVVGALMLVGGIVWIAAWGNMDDGERWTLWSYFGIEKRSADEWTKTTLARTQPEHHDD